VRGDCDLVLTLLFTIYMVYGGKGEGMCLLQWSMEGVMHTIVVILLVGALGTSSCVRGNGGFN